MNNYPAIRIALAKAMGWTKNRGKGWSRAVPANERDMTWESREHCPDPKHSDADCMELVDWLTKQNYTIYIKFEGAVGSVALWGRDIALCDWQGDNYREGVVELAYDAYFDAKAADAEAEDDAEWFAECVALEEHTAAQIYWANNFSVVTDDPRELSFTKLLDPNTWSGEDDEMI